MVAEDLGMLNGLVALNLGSAGDANTGRELMSRAAVTIAHEQIASKTSDVAQESSDLRFPQKLTTVCVQRLDRHFA